MIRILMACLLVASFSSQAADYKFNAPGYNNEKIVVITRCVERYVFAITLASGRVAMSQIFVQQSGKNDIPQPMRCRTP